MDLITATVNSLRVGRVRGRRVTEAGPTGVRMPVVPRLGFHTIRAGEGWLITNTSAPVRVRAGDVIYASPLAEHGIARTPCSLDELPTITKDDVPVSPAAADFEFLCATYPAQPTAAIGLLRNLPDVFAFTPDYAGHPGLSALIAMLSDDMTQAAPGSEAARSALIDLIFVHILRHLQRSAPTETTVEPGLAEVLDLIHEHPEKPWTVDQLSAVASMSRSAFTRRFGTVMGAPPMTYLIDWRLTTAARLLQETDTPVAGVARRVGYSTPFALTNAFRRKYGVAPSHYRRACLAR